MYQDQTASNNGADLSLYLIHGEGLSFEMRTVCQGRNTSKHATRKIRNTGQKTRLWSVRPSWDRGLGISSQPGNSATLEHRGFDGSPSGMPPGLSEQLLASDKSRRLYDGAGPGSFLLLKKRKWVCCKDNDLYLQEACRTCLEAL